MKALLFILPAGHHRAADDRRRGLLRPRAATIRPATFSFARHRGFCRVFFPFRFLFLSNGGFLLLLLLLFWHLPPSSHTFFDSLLPVLLSAGVSSVFFLQWFRFCPCDSYYFCLSLPLADPHTHTHKHALVDVPIRWLPLPSLPPFLCTAYFFASLHRYFRYSPRPEGRKKCDPVLFPFPLLSHYVSGNNHSHTHITH